jgi:hypothetical protein
MQLEALAELVEETRPDAALAVVGTEDEPTRRCAG